MKMKYVSPEVEIILIEVERGFAGSGAAGLPDVGDDGSAISAVDGWNA